MAQCLYGGCALLITLRIIFILDAVPYLNVIGRTLTYSSGPILMSNPNPNAKPNAIPN